MPYPATAIANEFLRKGFAEGVPIDPMKLQKLVYYANGWCLAFTDQPLIDEQVECWKYGPVVRSLFHRAKGFGAGPIPNFLTREMWEHGPAFPVMNDADAFHKQLVDSVWNAYKGYSGVKLSNMTHEPGAPWDVVMKQYGGAPPRGTDIPVEVIRSHFKKLREGNGG